VSDNDENTPSGDDSKIVSINGDSTSNSLEETMRTLQEQLQKSNNSYLYLRADFENYKSQAIKERSELAKYGAERLIVALLEPLDTFDRALQMPITAENINTFKEGIVMTAKELLNTLSRFGVKESDPLGNPFDPLKHEALSSEETDAYPPGHICRVFKKAYLMHDKVIRPAQVVVARAPSENA
jgi:molecular chaperone GrpE